MLKQPHQQEISSLGGRIGKLLLDSGCLTTEQVEQVWNYQQKKSLRFGLAAIELGFINEADLQFALARQFDYACLQPGDGVLDERIITAYAPLSGHGEQFRSLRNELTQRWFQRGRKSLVVLGEQSDTNASVLLANLAVVFTQLGERTLVLDANLRNGCQHELFHLENRKGLSDLLAGRAEKTCIHSIQALAGLDVLTCGSTAPNPQELLARSHYRQLLIELEHQYDVILLDVPALTTCADAQVVASLVQGVVVIARQHSSSLKSIQNLLTSVQNAGAEIVGSVLTGSA
jgi:protein-tyrosine kinase